MSSTEGGFRGIGEWRGPGSIPDDLAPGQPPHPSEGRQGPPIAIPVERWEQHLKAIDTLGEAMIRSTVPDLVANVASGNTDADGALDLLIYRVSAGLEAHMMRLTVNAINVATGNGYTPSSPYSGASAYLEVYNADSSLELGSTGLLDFASGVSTGPQGSMFPGVFTDNVPQAMMVRGPQAFALRVRGGPASSQVFARYQVQLRRMRGVA